MPTVAEIVSGLRAGTISQQQGEEMVQAEIDAAVSAAVDRDGMAMCLMTGMLAGRSDANVDKLIDRAYDGADKMIARRKR